MGDKRCKPQVWKSLKFVLAQIPVEVEQVICLVVDLRKCKYLPAAADKNSEQDFTDQLN